MEFEKWCNIELELLKGFKAFWTEMNKVWPDRYPLNLSFGDYNEQYLNWQNNKEQEEEGPQD